MGNSYNGWANWATWNTWVSWCFETRDQIDSFKWMVEEYKASIENSYFQGMTCFDEIDWESIYEAVEDREDIDEDDNKENDE